MTRVVRAVTVLVAGVWALAGCAGPDTVSPPAPPKWTGSPPALGEVPVIRSGAEISLPLDPYVPSGDDDELVRLAKQVVVGRCMTRFGFSGHGPAASISGKRPRHLGRYGVFDAKSAAEHGYVGPPRPLGPAPADRQLSEVERDALQGNGSKEIRGQRVPDGGCHGEANREIGERPAAETELLALLQKQATFYTEQDDRLLAGFKLWSGCMARAGFSYPQPWAANDQGRWKDPRNRDEQIRTATADVACKHEVNLVGVWVAVESAYQRHLMEPHSNALAVARQRLEAQRATALKVLEN